MAESGTQAVAPSKMTTFPLVCRLRFWEGPKGRPGRLPGGGEVELENVSSTPVELVVWMSPLQYPDLLVKDAQENVVSEGHYGDCFSPMLKPYTLCLRPGEKYVGNVHLFGNVPERKQQPGWYTVQAIYEYE